MPRRLLLLLLLLLLQVYAEVVGLAADCLIDSVLRAVLAAALAAAPGISTPEAAAVVAGNSTSRAAAQRVGPLCCRLLQHACTQVKATLLLHVQRQQLRPEAEGSSDTAFATDELACLLAQDGAPNGSDNSRQQQQQQQAKQQQGSPLLTEQLAPLLQVAAALQKVLEADVLLLLQLAATHPLLLQQTFRPIEQRLALLSLNPFIGSAPLGARKEVFCGFTGAT